MRSTRKGQKDQVQAYNTRRNKTNAVNVSNYEENIDKSLQYLKEKIKTKKIFKDQFGEKGTAICVASTSNTGHVSAEHRLENSTISSAVFDKKINHVDTEKRDIDTTNGPECCVNTEENQRTFFNVPESDDDADFCDSSDNLYVPETTDESDKESDFYDATSVISNSKQKHHVSFQIHDETSENKQTEDLLSQGKEEDDKKRIRQRDYCFYCESLILNFARHVIRNHSNEPEVQKALSMPKNSKSRKQIFTLLRKKGNYITNVQNSTFKPMKKNKYSTNEDYLPCTKCLGFYSRKQLWKHKKLCDSNNLTSNVQVDAQNFLLRNIKVNQKLKDDVFPRMRPDKISMIAKKDPLICAFGFQYLRTHREKHFINVTSRKCVSLVNY
ncbi:uncharacterized protein [Epargyreus clarus]|uniref:uncharacterized protein n=1 Tax=Epargyreus clarus TaxID=520877 RepID=UPI003C2FB3CC